MTDKICEILKSIKKNKPFIHCITNPISINGCANAILSLHAKPIMIEHPEEVGEIVSSADALMINVGNLTDARIISIKTALAKAAEKGIPVLLDAVGAACSKFRRKYIMELLDIAVPSVIKGNYSEIMALYNSEYFSRGIDADETLDECRVTEAAKKLSEKYKTVILASGKTDIVTDGEKVIYIKNGTEQMALVTGTGCMLGALCTAFLTSAKQIDAAVSACCYFGICGEVSKTEKGNGSFYVNLMDKISTLDKEEITKHLKMEERK